MEQNEILDALTQILQRVLDNPEIRLTSATTADEVEGWDSLNHVIFVVEIERHFGIKFQAAEMEELKNAGELAHVVAKRLSQQPTR
jgi:acyl carrier protein